MNKKLKTLLFVIGATIFNLLIASLCFISLFFLYARFLYPIIPEESQVMGFIFVFVSAIALSLFVYRFALKFLMKKIDFDKHFDPIFGKGNNKKPGL